MNLDRNDHDYSAVRKNYLQRFGFAILLAAAFFLVSPTDIFAASFSVNSMDDIQDANPGDGLCQTATGVCTLRAAITETNALPTDDSITVPTGTYTISLIAANEDNNAGGDFDIRGNLIIDGFTLATFIEAATSPGTATERVFHFPIDGITATLADITIRNGVEPTDGGGISVNGANSNIQINNCVIRDNVSGLRGGGIYINNTTAAVTLNSATITNNSSVNNNGGAVGGGIGINQGTLISTSSNISNNSAVSNGNLVGAAGGGIYGSEASINLTNTTVSDNNATSNGNVPALGGGISMGFSTVTIQSSTISNNNAVASSSRSFGGGIYSDRGIVNLISSTASGNSADDGGGIRNVSAGSTAATLDIKQSAIINNTAQSRDGGGILNASISGSVAATTNITNSTIGGNSSGGGGGGILNWSVSSGGDAIVNINFSTVAGNSANTDNNGANQGGGIENRTPTSGGTTTVNLKNSIVADNTIGTGGTGPDIAGTITSENFNHIEDLSGGVFTPMLNDVFGTDPQLSALAPSGGNGTPNYMPAQTSPVVDAIPNGNNGCNVAVEGGDTDQRTMMRPLDSNQDSSVQCEKGAVEIQAPTAAAVSISGRVSTGRRGLPRATVEMTDTNGNVRTARTNMFGYFRFEDVEIGETYIFNVYSKRYQFAPQVVNVSDSITDLNFLPSNQPPNEKGNLNTKQKP